MTLPAQSYREIPLTQGQVTIVDDCDYDVLIHFKWCVSRKRDGNFHAVRSIDVGLGREHYKLYPMHRQIMGLPRGDLRVVDHINHDTLDNRRCNLRIATHQQNMQNYRTRKDNTSGYRGVSFYKTRSHLPTPWRALICGGGGKPPIDCGYHATPLEAAIAYDHKCLELRGEFAVLNFPQEVS